jgi:hypothetical protein
VTRYSFCHYEGPEVLTMVVFRYYIFWDITPCRPFKCTDVSEEYIASIFTVEGKARQNTICLPLAFILVSCFVYSSTQFLRNVR